MCPTGTTLCLLNNFSSNDATSEFRRAFHVIDVDQDGKISGDDLRSFYASVPSSGRDEDDMIGAMISLADGNKDGFVQYEEFEKVLNGKKNGRNANGNGDGGVMEEVFKVMDKDGDGKLGVNDLKSYLNLVGIKVDDDEIKAMIKLANCGDAVSFNDFVNIFSVL